MKFKKAEIPFVSRSFLVERGSLEHFMRRRALEKRQKELPPAVAEVSHGLFQVKDIDPYDLRLILSF